MKFNQLYDKINSYINDYMHSLSNIPEPILSGMRYSVIDSGKRLRPILFYIGANITDNVCNEDDIMLYCTACELIHSYSLVHDDMPCMDNDSLRRNKPTTHIKYGEGMGLLIGDALLNQANEILTLLATKDENYAKASYYITKQAGSQGMIAGQCLDMNDNISTELDLYEMYSLKTACLIKASLAGGAIATGGSDKQIEILEEIAENMGLAFQIADDILEQTSCEEVLGKNIDSDNKNDKKTLIKLKGLEYAINKKNVLEYNSKVLAETLCNNKLLLQILDKLSNRKK